MENNILIDENCKDGVSRSALPHAGNEENNTLSDKDIDKSDQKNDEKVNEESNKNVDEKEEEEKCDVIEDVISLMKTSPSMLNDLADAIIAENFDTLQNTNESTSSKTDSSTEDPGKFCHLSIYKVF